MLVLRSLPPRCGRTFCAVPVVGIVPPEGVSWGWSGSRAGVGRTWWAGRPSVLRRREGGSLEHAEHGQALQVGDGSGKQRLQPSFAPAPVTGFAHAEILEVVDLRSTFARRRNNALVPGWPWAAWAASMRRWCRPTMMVRPPLPAVQRSRSGQISQVRASK